MAEYTEPPVPEKDGYRSRRGWVKDQPGNNDHYVGQFADDPWYPAIKRAHERLSAAIPGYNIRQIKAKFGDLRYYISQGECTDSDWERGRESAYQIIAEAEVAVRRFEETGEWDDGSV